MKLIIAEKPDQALKLAAPFGHKKRAGYLEVMANEVFPNGAIFTWAVGHLCELIPPEEYDVKWKKWSLDTLPIIPNDFKHRVVRSKWKQFQVIKQLTERSDIREVVIASDAGREGEAIVRIILNLCKNKKPMKRLWISSLTQASVLKGFQQLLGEEETRLLYYEALSRACADWLVGMNASRAYTLLLQQKGVQSVFSTGRVQTPTLALIVKREKEIANFKSEPFWEVRAKMLIDGKHFEAKWHKDGEFRLQNKDMAHKIAEFCRKKRAVIHSIEKERKQFQPPYFFNLSALQATANQLYKFSPQKTLDLAQALYLKGVISYPRSDSSFVTKEEAAMFPDILKKLNHLSQYRDYFPLATISLVNHRRYVNEKKVTDHYAIIPTEQVVDPKSLSDDEEKIYDLIVRRLIAAHMEKAIVDYTTVHTLVDGRATFLSKGKVDVQEGWRKVIFQKQKKEEDEQILPPLKKDEVGHVSDISVREGKTEPPKRYTEGQLITLMKTAGRYIEDETLTKVLNETEGLGTEATRAGIIGVLKDRQYIEVKKNQVYATEKGKLLIEAIGDSVLASPEMTAKWEQRLREIGKGKASPQAFMEQAKKLSAKLIEDAKAQASKWSFAHLNLDSIANDKPKGKAQRRRNTPLGDCKKCGGKIIDKGTFYGCSNYAKTKCNFTISRKILTKKISQANVKKLLKDGETAIIKGFKKDEKTFDALLIWNEKENKIEFKQV